MCEEDSLEHERENGKFAAELLVTHMVLMGAASCIISVEHDNERYTVTVTKGGG